MTDEDQERFEDYLNLEQYIDDLQAGRSPQPPQDISPHQASIYRMAEFFHSASATVSQPRPMFVEQLRMRLLKQDVDPSLASSVPSMPNMPELPSSPSLPVERTEPVEEPEIVVPVIPPVTTTPAREVHKRSRDVSRRRLLTTGTTIAASIVIGAGIDRAVTGTNTSKPGVTATPKDNDDATPYTGTTTSIVGDVPTTWHFVTSLAELGKGPVRFVSDAIIGFVIRSDDNPKEQNEIIAMSAACTHMGCIVHWQDKDRKFICPCHNGAFNEYGAPAQGNSSKLYLSSLPRLETKVEGGNVYVKVPTSKK